MALVMTVEALMENPWEVVKVMTMIPAAPHPMFKPTTEPTTTE